MSKWSDNQHLHLIQLKHGGKRKKNGDLKKQAKRKIANLYHFFFITGITFFNHEKYTYVSVGKRNTTYKLRL